MARQIAGQRLVEDDTQGEEIAGPGGRATEQHLGGDVPHATGWGGRRTAVAAGEGQVHHRHCLGCHAAAIGLDEDVGALEISMQQAVTVKLIDALEGVDQGRCHEVQGTAAAGFGEGLAIDQVHHQEGAPAGGGVDTEVVDTDQRWMAEQRKNPVLLGQGRKAAVLFRACSQ